MSANSIEFPKQLLAWFDQFGRHDLPWQHNKTPYRVWVSEIMLQQTQVQTVIPYYLRFMERFPDLQTLAQASQDEVLAHWSGLGYYARGRNLHKTAQMVMNDFGGHFPDNFEDILKLPGIGRSTAGAILSIAYKKRFAILDGNVKRVLCRLDAVESWSGEKTTEAKLWQRADELTPQKRFDDYTQAIMDLGATLCTRSKPKCNQCPVQKNCQALQTDRVSRFPLSKPKKSKPTRHNWFLVARNRGGQVFLQKRPQQGIWGGLWSLPQFEDESTFQEMVNLHTKKVGKSDTAQQSDLLKWPEFKHTFSHYHLRLHPVQLERIDHLSLEGGWFSLPDALTLGLPAPIRRIVEQLES